MKCMHTKVGRVAMPIALAVCAAALCASAEAATGGGADGPPEPPDFAWVLEHIRPDHPRLFLNQDILARIRREGLTQRQAEWLEELKKRVEEYPAPPELDPENLPNLRDGNKASWHYYAAHAALAYLLTGERTYYDRGVAHLRFAADFYAAADRQDPIAARENRPHNLGRCPMRIALLSAYDWLYNDLPEAERQRIGKALFGPLKDIHEHWYAQSYMHNTPINTYYDTVTGWYLGLVFLHAGVEGATDEVCTELLRDGYKQHLSVSEAFSAGPDGIFLYGALRIHLVDYFLRHTIEPRGGKLRHGWGDAYHKSNLMDGCHKHYLYRTADLYRGVADEATLHKLTAMAQFLAPVDYQISLNPRGYWYQTSAAPLLMSPPEHAEEEMREVVERLPRARYFPDPVGHTFMNSGWGEGDTYCMFIAGRQTTKRKHYDENHFTIYRQGFLAMDTGVRGIPVPPELKNNDHLTNYRFDTVAHNCVLIQMEGETLPGYWGIEAEANTGGMNKNYGAEVKAFETNDRYTYIASDATFCYHQDKAQEVVRQFLFVYPDYFVVFDRVISKKPEQKKRWLLHTQYEPKVQGDTFSADHRQGRIFVRTLLPQQGRAEKVGGPGKEFWADGRNWPKWRPGARWEDPEEHLFGRWRMEISPPQGSRRDLFLHLIQVGDRQELASMAPSELVDEPDGAGVEFDAQGATVRVVFNRRDEVGGHIRVEQDGEALVDRPLAQRVMPQEKLGRMNE